jgi:hypothetical protein
MKQPHLLEIEIIGDIMIDLETKNGIELAIREFLASVELKIAIIVIPGRLELRPPHPGMVPIQPYVNFVTTLKLKKYQKDVLGGILHYAIELPKPSEDAPEIPPNQFRRFCFLYRHPNNCIY